MERLSQTEQGLTAKTLLEANIPTTAPLHYDYEWDNEIAANLWREQQSRVFIDSCEVVVQIAESNETTHIRALHITTEKGKYEPLTLIVQNKTKYQALLESAKGELRAFERKYKILSELQPIFTAINDVVKEE